MYLYLVRHGQSTGNEKKLFFGVTDYPLTELGHEQAREAAAKLKQDNITFARCCASDLARAWDTAAPCLEDTSITAEACPALREQDMGEFEGVSWEEAQDLHGDLVMRLVTDWFHTTPPKGESPDAMEKRVGACVDEMVARGEDTLIVAHNGSLSMVLKHLGLADEGTVMTHDWFFAHGTYSAIRIEDGRAELIHFNR